MMYGQPPDAMISEVAAFGFWDFKIPKAFRAKLFECYPLTGQDSIYKINRSTLQNFN